MKCLCLPRRFNCWNDLKYSTHVVRASKSYFAKSNCVWRGTVLKWCRSNVSCHFIWPTLQLYIRVYWMILTSSDLWFSYQNAKWPLYIFIWHTSWSVNSFQTHLHCSVMFYLPNFKKQKYGYGARDTFVGLPRFRFPALDTSVLKLRYTCWTKI